MSKTKTPSAKQAILEVLKVEPQASVAQIAVSAGVGRSAAGKLLAQLESDDKIRRTALRASRDGNRRLPDLWSLGEQPVANGANAKPVGATGVKPSEATDRLKPGQLEPLVLAYLKEHSASAPHGPTTVAKALGRSSGAVGNCLVRLAEAKKVKEVSAKPRRYSLAA